MEVLELWSGIRARDHTVGYLKIWKMGQLLVMTRSSGDSRSYMAEGTASRNHEAWRGWPRDLSCIFCNYQQWEEKPNELELKSAPNREAVAGKMKIMAPNEGRKHDRVI